MAVHRGPSDAVDRGEAPASGAQRRAPARLDTEGDPELLASAAAGDLAAVGELYDRHARHVWKVAYRALGDAAAEDVVHQLFLQLPSLAHSYDGRPSCRSWLCGIGLRLALRHRRGAGRLRHWIAAFSQTAADRSTRTPERDAMARQELVTLERALGRLSEKNRVVFVLVELEDLTSEEAARVLQIPAGTARRRLFDARRQLQAALDEGG
ncbi:MAG TPA: RNA polymerase sigma factor [Polyangiaceae bacterium]